MKMYVKTKRKKEGYECSFCEWKNKSMNFVSDFVK